jgi:aryl-alcohol dehydrogenase-like predicted oxidoreductase
MHTTLTTRRLGSTDMEITTVGFGAWAIGGGGWAFGWGPQDDAQSIATIRYAAERGINWIDTAAVYGLGHSEEVVRQALAEIPAAERPYIFTKCGLVWDEADRMASPRQVLRPESIRRECEASLRRLGVERIDLYQFHWPDETGTRVEDSWAEMARLVEQGKVRAAGVSNFDVGLLERCESIRHVDTLQPPFSLIRRRAAEAEISWCAAQPTSSRRSSAAISLSGMDCGPSRSGTAPPSRASRSHGRWRGPGSRAPSSAGARPSRWTAGSTLAPSSSHAKTWTTSPG